MFVFLLLRIVTDLTINMDEFVKQDLPFGELVGLICRYYGYQLLAYVAEMGGVVIVFSATFTVAMMNHTNELTALLASGISMRRVVVPIALAAVAISALIVVDRELIIPIPHVRRNLVRSRDNPFGTEGLNVRVLPDDTGAVWQAPKFVPGRGEMTDPVVILRDRSLSQVGSIQGAVARPYTEPGRRKGWIFRDAVLSRSSRSVEPWPVNPSTERVYCEIRPEKIVERALEAARQRNESRAADGNDAPPADAQGAGPLDTADLARRLDAGEIALRTIVAEDPEYGLKLTAERFAPEPLAEGEVRRGRLEAPRFEFRMPDGQVLGILVAESAEFVPDGRGGFWRLSEGGLVYPSALTGEEIELRDTERWMEYMSSSEISRLLKYRNVTDRQSALMARHTRFTDPLNNLVMLLLAVPFLLSRERNIKASASLCLLTVGTFYAFIYLARQIDLPPTLAAWLPILLFGPISVVMFDSVKT
jgi:hypothetical protein